MIKRIFGLVMLGAVAFGVWQYQAIADWLFLRSYQPSPRIAALANEAALSEVGQRYFYVGDPAINDKQQFNQNCPDLEETLVLGCYADGRTYLLDVARPELDGVMEVTAAHEMLHAAYARLSNGERREIDAQLRAAYAGITDPTLRELINDYRRSDGEAIVPNELHSILATQVTELPPELETYFSQYFRDRGRVVALYMEYEGIFMQIRADIEQLKAEIELLRVDISSLEADIATLQAELERLNDRIERLRAQNRVEESNQLVPTQNAAVANHNQLINEYRGLIAEHNAQVAEVNDLVLLQNDLVNSLDSSFQPL